MQCFCVIQREIPDRRNTQECLRKNYAILISYRCNKLDENCRACDFNCSTIFILKHYFVERKTLWRFSNLQNDDSYFKSIKSSIYNVKLLFIKFTDRGFSASSSYVRQLLYVRRLLSIHFRKFMAWLELMILYLLDVHELRCRYTHILHIR